MKTELLQLRILTAQKDSIRQAAQQANLGMTEWILRRLFPPAGETFHSLVKEIEVSEGTPGQSVSLAQLNDFLSGLSILDFSSAVQITPPVRLGPYLSNYIAAMVETAAHHLEIASPDWTGEVVPLDIPMFVSELRSLRLYLLLNSPPAFRRRNIFIDSTVGDRV